MSCLFPTGWGWLPILYAAGTMLSFLITYIVAVLSKHIMVLFPEISDTGSYPIESNIFTLLMSLSCVLGGLNLVVRYLQVDLMIRKASKKRYRGLQNENKRGNWNLPRFCNKVALVSSVIVMVSGFVIGAFPNVGKSEKTHYAATGIFFTFAYVFCVFQTILTGAMKPPYKWLYRTRVIMIVLITITIICFTIFTFYKSKEPYLKYIEIRILNACEWLYALLLCSYVVTFAPEFEEINFVFFVEECDTENIH